MNNNGKKRNGIIEPFQRFFQIEASGGIVLLFFTLIALIWANSSWGDTYHHLWESELRIGFEHGNIHLTKSLLHWVNDGLMVIFFFVVGLEIKRELIAGELSSVKKAALPIAAAIGGMVVPASIYLLANNNPETSVGWGIPMATDIAFSLGILSLLGKRVPIALKVFLVAFAIVDDLGAVLIIALFYSNDIHWNYLLIGLILVLILVIFNRANINNMYPYIFVGLVVWFFFLKSGIHPTIAGVMIAFTIPVSRKIRLSTFRERMKHNLDKFCIDCDEENNEITLSHEQLSAIDNMEDEILRVQSPVQRLEHDLHGFVTYLIMPLFALINAGVVLKGASLSDLFSGLSGIIEISLVAGKVIGITLFAYIAVKLGFAALPDNVRWKHIMGLGFLGGMGFTMSLFVANLAFKSEEFLNPAKTGIIVGSFIAGLAGYFLLRTMLKKGD